MDQAKFLLTGDTALTLEFGNEISPDINKRIRAFNVALEMNKIDGIVETVPTYRSITVHYKPEIIKHNELVEKMQVVLENLDSINLPPSHVLEVPVLYGGEYGPDIHFVAENAGISVEQVIEIHSSREYLIYMLGFTPGFTYLGGLDTKIATPRLQVPRVKIPGGSVGIAGEQTGVYPIESPGGWQLIGQTPVKMYDPKRETPILPVAGDYMKFKPISQQEFDQIKTLADKGEYKCKRYAKEEK